MAGSKSGKGKRSSAGCKAKRDRNKARRESGKPTNRGSKRTPLTPIQLALMGKGPVARIKPIAVGKRQTRIEDDPE